MLKKVSIFNHFFIIVYILKFYKKGLKKKNLEKYPLQIEWKAVHFQLNLLFSLISEPAKKKFVPLCYSLLM